MANLTKKFLKDLDEVDKITTFQEYSKKTVFSALFDLCFHTVGLKIKYLSIEKTEFLV